MSNNNKIGATMVVGAGIGGIQASLDLADLGFKVHLVEKNPSIGGIMAQLDKTFPTNDCSLCILAPKMVEAFRHPNIELHAYSEVESVVGEAGNFEVNLLKKARSVDGSRCKSCSECTVKCPVKVPDEYNEGLNKRKAIHIPFPQAVPSSFVIDRKNCLYFTKGVCKLCEKFCDAKAVNYEQVDERVKLNVGAIILAMGAKAFDPSNLSQYGHGKYKNVVSSIEFERILNASGPFKGEVLRPSDETHPEKILWVNCVGSRSPRLNQGYCSSVCCMYSIKEAMITKEHQPDIDCHIHFIDIRTVGKGFEEYYLRAQDLGIKFQKSRIAEITEISDTRNLAVSYENLSTGELVSEVFDMVVLSVGLDQTDQIKDIANTYGIELDEYDFCSTNFFTPLETIRDGIYVCGSLSGPKDIPETVAEASGASGKASKLLYQARNSLITTLEYPPEVAVDSQEPRVGVFVCHCGINIGSTVNVPEVVEYTKTLPGVVHAEENIYSCSQDAQEKIKKTIKEQGLNRVVVASCTPRTHEPLFQNTVRNAGLNPYLFEFANIREQCSWVHMHDKEAATEKAKDLVAMSVSKARLLEPIYESSVSVTPACLVIGGGIAGMTAALELANQEFEVSIIEKDIALGGLARNVHYLLENENPQERLGKMIDLVEKHEKIKVYLGTTIDDIKGFVGNFVVSFTSNREAKNLEFGAIIVATGGKEYKPVEYNYGNNPRIVTQQELEGKIAAGDISARDIVMIQCVGSRNEVRPNCSRICCSQAIKNALKLKDMNPEKNITILYRDIRTYGLKEDYYRKAREKGIIFLRFDEKEKPEVTIKKKQLSVVVNDTQIGNKVLLKPDLLVLSAGFIPADNKKLSQMLKVPLEQNGFFLEAHVKLRPLDFANDGIFLCGAAQWPKFMNEAIAQAEGAAARACTVLSKEKITVKGAVAVVDEDKCVGCGACEMICPFGAIRIDNEEVGQKAKVIASICKACGVCGATCPKKAISISHFTDNQILNQIHALTKKMEEIV
ncbi:MAG: FAD-dependent oxidoreductase [Candidatus Hodarchaeota archaeon]